jgi:hypothetical protein
MEDVFRKKLVVMKENRKTKEDITSCIGIMKNISFAQLKATCTILDRDDILAVLHVKLGRKIENILDIWNRVPKILQPGIKTDLLKFYCDGIIEDGDMSDFHTILCCINNETPYSACEKIVDFLIPPETSCLECGSTLQTNNMPCKVSVYKIDGPSTALKLCLRCSKCKLSYGYSKYGSPERGFKFYNKSRPLVEASDESFVDKLVCQYQIHLA